MAKGWILAAAIIVSGNLAVLGSARWNRGGVDALLMLTERELPVVRQGEENTGLALRLVWQTHLDGAWLGRAKLGSLGFDVSVDPTVPQARSHYEKQAPRDGYIVLEYGGAAWEAWAVERRQRFEAGKPRWRKMKPAAAERAQVQAQRRLDYDLAMTSRLFAIDTGTHAARLRERYPDKATHAVVPAVIAIRWQFGNDAKSGEISGWARPRGNQIHVDRGHGNHFRDLASIAFRDWQSVTPPSPRYTVELAFGRRHEPWIANVVSTR